MNPRLRATAALQGGVILRPQALRAGLVDDEIARLRAQGHWHGVRRGAYVPAELWQSLDHEGRHRALTRAVHLQLTAPAVISHVSAAVMLGLPIWDLDLSCVHVTRADLHSPRREAGVHHHAGHLADDDVVIVDGVPVTSPARTAVDLARTVDFEQAVVTADGVLRLPDVGPQDLLDALDRARSWQGARSAGRVITFADGRAESVGESRHRVQILRLGLPVPDLQVVVSGPGGSSDRVDFLFEAHLTIGEFDGKGKYQRLLRNDETPQDAVWREKRREDRLRELGYEVVRPAWADLYRDREVAQRYRRAFERSSRRR
ncbi:MAG TPA: hypothetical protein VIP77_18220 [Jiangellaceae bacterium]